MDCFTLPSRLYAIVDTAAARAGPAELAGVLLRAGVRLLQYRHKGRFTETNWRHCRAIAAMAAEHGATFVVNDRADVAWLCGARGVHVGQDDLPAAKARAVMGKAAIVGVSTHSVEQLAAAGLLPADYLAVGPVFATSSKERPDPVVGLEMVRAARERTRKPLVAIGGITVQNARAVINAGADAVAVIGGLLGAGSIEERAREFLALLGD